MDMISNERSDFESKRSAPESNTDNNISRASPSDYEPQIQMQHDLDESDEYIPKTEEEVAELIDEIAGNLRRKATLLLKKKRG